MPRPARVTEGGTCYHVINRGNGRARVFHRAGDYAAFIGLLLQACRLHPMRVLAFCLMPNHFHLVLWPHEDGDLSRWMQWLTTAHVRRYHRRRRSSGHVWQGRFKSFPIQSDDHLWTVLSYVERNPVRAHLVRSADQWPWSSISAKIEREMSDLLNPGPIRRPSEWLRIVNEPQTESEMNHLRRCVNRGAPYGSQIWVTRKVKEVGLESTVRAIGRPKNPTGRARKK